MRRWLLIAALLASCKRGTSALPSAPEQDALWKLAPLTATHGVVVSSHGVQALESAWREINHLLDAAPELAGMAALAREESPRMFPNGEVSLASAGMTADRGMAIFFSRSGARVVFLPVVDRTKFVAFAQGTTDADGDHLGDYTCRPVRDRYACARPVEQLGRIGEGTLRRQVALPGTRGDIEIASEDADEHAELGAVIQFERGQLVMRAGIRTPKLEGKIVNASAQRFDTSKLGGFGVLNLGSSLASLPLPREPLAGGYSLADLIANMMGPIITSFPAGAPQGEIRVPMKNPDIARALVTHCEDIDYLAILSSNVSDGVCHLTVPGVSMNFDVWVDGADLRARVKNPSPTTAAPLRPTAIANELAGGEWAYALYGRGTLIGWLPPIDRALPAGAIATLRMLSLLSEAGIGVRRDGDMLRVVIAIRTVWSNPDPIVTKWLALPFDQILDPAGIETARQIAATVPSAPMTDDLKSGTALLVPLAGLALIAGYMSPSYLDKEQLRNLGVGGAPVPSPAEVADRMTTFTESMCACNDATCAQRVIDEMTAFSVGIARRGYKPPRLPPDEQTKAVRLAREMADCTERAFRVGSDRAANDFIAKNLKFKERLCACKDLACGEAVNLELTTWSDAYMTNLPAGSTMSKADDRKMQEIETAMRACMQTLRASHK